MSDQTVTIALGAWNQYQQLIRSASDSMWKTRATFYAVTSGLVATGYSSSQPFMYQCIPFIAMLFFLLESGSNRLQLQYIEQSMKIERTLTDILAGESQPYLPEDGVNTALSTPTVSDLKKLLALKRYLLWLPYLVVSGAVVVLWKLEIYAVAA